METKQCSKCKQVKPLAEYTRSKIHKMGLYPSCKDCKSKDNGTITRRKPPELNVSEIQLAYLAGLIDGEGCISMSKCTKGARVFYVVTTAIAMCDSFLYDLCKETGIGYMMHKANRHPRWKDLYRWQIGANACRSLLPLLLPYLRVKRRQAELALKYLQLSLHCPRAPGCKNKQAYLLAVENIRSQLGALNKRGK